MRYSVILLLIVTFSITGMEQPPRLTQQPQQRMQISQEQFAAQAEQRSGSYLSLLPADVQRLTASYAYSTIEDAIRILREKNLADPASREAFLNGQQFNTAIINYLAQRFPEYDKNRFLIAVMLNTPASLGLAFGLNQAFINQHSSELDYYYYPGFFKNINNSEEIIKRYLQNAAINYQQAIDYISNFFNNLRFWNDQFQRESYNERRLKQYDQIYKSMISSIIALLLDKFAKDLVTQKMPELKVILDLDRSLVGYLLQTTSQNPIIRRYIKKNKFFLDTNGIAAFQKQLVEEWAVLLLEALKSDNHEKIVQLLNAVYDQFSSPIPYFKEYFLAHVKSPLTDYFLRVPIEVLRSDHFNKNWLFHYQKELGDLISFDIIKKATNADQIIKWLNFLALDLDVRMPSGWELEQALWARDFPFLKYMMTERHGSHWVEGWGRVAEREFNREKKIQDRGIKFLLAVAQSLHANAAALNILIARGADINGADEQGVTILMHAIKNKHFDIANALLNNANINVNACDNIGHNVLSYAQFLSASPEKEILIATLKERGAKEPNVCVIQ